MIGEKGRYGFPIVQILGLENVIPQGSNRELGITQNSAIGGV